MRVGRGSEGEGDKGTWAEATRRKKAQKLKKI